METRPNVAVVGYGPTGMAAAALLGKLGHNVIVIERWPALYGLPRFTHIDDETARTLQSVCDIDRAMADSTPTEYEWVNGEGEVLLKIPTFPGSQGFPAHNSIYQPDIENALDERLRDLPNVEVRQGWVVTGLQQDGASVRLEIAPWNSRGPQPGRTETLEVDYVIGADGARSVIREAIGTGRIDYGFHEQWINIDTEWLRPHDEHFAIAKQFCDPARGHMFMGIGQSRQRFEFAVLEGENAAELEKPEAAWSWLKQTHGLGPEDVCIVRQLSYTFTGRVAEQWRSGRVFIAGDAAHVMPPYLGQGACSGIRDSANLAWKLHLVLAGQAPDSLLDTYQEERMPHAIAAVQMSIGLGRVANTTDPAEAEARDAAFKAGQAPPPPALPKLSGSLFPDAGPDTPVGSLAPQGRLRNGAEIQRGDDVLGYGFHLIVTPAAFSSLDEPQHDRMQRLGIRSLVLGPEQDVDGTYSSFLDAHGAEAAIVRPDHIVYATAGPGGLPTLLDDLAARLLVPAGRSTEAAQ